MALKGALVGWLGSGSTGDTIDRVIFRTRQPEGAYLPIGRGLWDLARARRENRSVRNLPQQIDRRDIVPVPVGPAQPISRGKKPEGTIVPTMVVSPNTRGTPASVAIARGSAVPQEKPRIPAIQKKESSMDLGDILGTGLDLYAKYKTITAGPTRVALPTAAVAPAPQTYWPGGYGVSEMAGPQLIANTPGSGFDNPFAEMIAQPPDEALADGMKGWAYKKSCGEWKWVKTGRRRRRKLLTDSDYNGLLKLQTLKVNSNMNIAIAKSIGR